MIILRIINKFFFLSLILLGVTFIPTIVRAEVSSTPDMDFPVTDIKVSASAVGPDGTVYIGGAFTKVGTNIGFGVPIGTATGLKTGVFPKADSVIYSSIPDGSGGWYIGGAFTNVGGVFLPHLAHINPNGTVDASFNPNIDSDVKTLALDNTNHILYIGGYFTTIDSVNYNYLAAINTTVGANYGTAIDTFNPNLNDSVLSIALSGDGTTLYVGGGFTTINSVIYNSLAAINTANGAAIPTFNPNMNSSVYTVALDGTTLYVGGFFWTVGGNSAYHQLAAINTTNGAAIATFNPNMDGVGESVSALAVDSTNHILYIGGDFTTINSVPYNKLAAIDIDAGGGSYGAAIPAFNPDLNGLVSALALSSDGTTLYAGGGFTIVSSATYNYLTAINTTNGAVIPTFNPNMNEVVYSLALSANGTILYAGGNFTMINWYGRQDIAAIDATGQVTSFNPIIDGPVYSLTLSSDGTKLYMGGDFTTIDTVTYNKLAAINTTTGAAIPAFNPNMDNASYSLLLDGTTLYAGGGFTTVHGDSHNYLAAIDTTIDSSGGVSSVIAGFNPNMDGVGEIVSSLALDSTNHILYIGGDFTTINSVPYNKLAAIDTTIGVNYGTVISSFNPNVDSSVQALILDGTTLYVGGYFTAIGGNSAYHRLAAINTANGAVIPTFNPNMGDAVLSLTFDSTNNILYAGGDFYTVDSVDYNHLAAINATTGVAIDTFNPNVNGAVSHLTFSGTTLYAGGDFGLIGGFSQPNFARFSSSGSTIISATAIAGVTPPVTGATPVTAVTAGTGYTGTVTWSGSPTTFAASTIYTATITLSAISGYTLTGVTENQFTIAGSTSATNSADSGVITAVFPATATVNSGYISSGSYPTVVWAQIQNPTTTEECAMGDNFSSVSGKACPTNTTKECASGDKFSSVSGKACPITITTISPVLIQQLTTQTKTLRQGITNINVKTLQQFLNSKGFTVSIIGAGSSGYETTYFGSKTKQALIRFQKANGLKPDGIFGPLTKKVVGGE